MQWCDQDTCNKTKDKTSWSKTKTLKMLQLGHQEGQSVVKVLFQQILLQWVPDLEQLWNKRPDTGKSEFFTSTGCVLCQLFWEKRLEGLFACDKNGEKMTSLQLPHNIQGTQTACVSKKQIPFLFFCSNFRMHALITWKCEYLSNKTRDHWIQHITFVAKTNAVCSHGSADRHTHRRTPSITVPSPLAKQRQTCLFVWC